MSTEIALPSETQRDDLHQRPRHEVEEAAHHWFDVAKGMKDVQDQLVEDLEAALNMCRSYQGIVALLQANDPNLVEARRLLTKYKMDYTTPQRIFKVYVDGIEITEHPDSIEGSEVEVLELTGEEYYGTQTVELIEQDGEMKLVPKGEIVAPEVDAYADILDPAPEDPETRDWLKESADGDE